jgi:hypothetical protein
MLYQGELAIDCAGRNFFCSSRGFVLVDASIKGFRAPPIEREKSPLLKKVFSNAQPSIPVSICERYIELCSRKLSESKIAEVGRFCPNRYTPICSG